MTLWSSYRIRLSSASGQLAFCSTVVFFNSDSEPLIVDQSLEELRLENRELLSDCIWQFFEHYFMKRGTVLQLIINLTH